MEELKLAAIERGLMAIRKRSTGPIIVVEARTGNSLGSFSTLEEALAAILTIPPLPVVEAPQAVGWHADVEYIVIPKVCANGWGPGCMCLDTTAIYLCAAPPCMLRAGCRGACHVHYSQLKVLGDLTHLAVSKTAAMAKDGKFDLENLPAFPRITSMKTVKQTERYSSQLTAKEITDATSGVIGMTIRWTGTEFLLVDKDGKVLDRVSSKAELFEDADNGIMEQ